MDTYENSLPNEQPQENLPEEVMPQPDMNQEAEPVEEPFQQIPVEPAPVKSPSPFADSPYQMPAQACAADDAAVHKPRKKAGGIWKRVMLVLSGAALILSGCYATAVIVSNSWADRMENMRQEFDSKLEDLQDQLEDAAADNSGESVSGSPVAAVPGGLTPGQVYAKNVQAVVLINSQVNTSMYGQSAIATSTGSGFVLTESGYVVTNFHVVDGATAVSVIMVDGQSYDATIVGYDATNDVALLKIEAENLQAVTVGSSADLIVGDQVVAIGNPLGELTSTLTVGYISAKERDVNTDGSVINMLQTDAAINSGNSGGPLFNMKGEVVGITTAKYSGTSSSGASIEGIGFAIPIDDVYDLFDDLMNYGYVTGAYLGVVVSDTNAEAAAYFGMPVGVYVQSVEEGFAAQKAGLQSKDIIVALGEYEVQTVSDLTRVLRKFEAGDTTTVTVFRAGREMKLDITLDEKPRDLNQ